MASIEEVTRRFAGSFMEWLEQTNHLSPKTAARVLYSRAVNGVVRVGMPQAVRDALEETAGNRPPLPGKVGAAARNRPQRKRRTAA